MSRDDIRKSGGGSASVGRAPDRRLPPSSATASSSSAASATATATPSSTALACRAPTPTCAPSRSTSSPRARCRRSTSRRRPRPTSRPTSPAPRSSSRRARRPTKPYFQIEAQGRRQHGDDLPARPTPATTSAATTSTFGNLGRDLPGPLQHLAPDPPERGRRQRRRRSTRPSSSSSSASRCPRPTPRSAPRRRCRTSAPALQVGNTFKPWGTRLGVLTALQYNNVHQTLREQPPHLQRHRRGGRQATRSTRLSRRSDYHGVKTTAERPGLGARARQVELQQEPPPRADRRLLARRRQRGAHAQGQRPQHLRHPEHRSASTPACATSCARSPSRGSAGATCSPGPTGLTLDWFGSWAQARQDDPLLRESLFNDIGGDYPGRRQ